MQSFNRNSDEFKQHITSGCRITKTVTIFEINWQYIPGNSLSHLNWPATEFFSHGPQAASKQLHGR